jgi:hypothetical protein
MTFVSRNRKYAPLAAYETAAETSMSHDMMLDPGRLAVAERIHARLESCVSANTTL